MIMRGAASSWCGAIVGMLRTRFFRGAGRITKRRAAPRVVVLLKKAKPGPKAKLLNEAMLVLKQGGKGGKGGCSASTFRRANRALKPQPAHQPRAGRAGGRALVVLLDDEKAEAATALAELRRHECDVLACSVSFDTALVPVTLADGREVVLHVAGAISSAGCWLHPSVLKPISGAGSGGCYDSAAFLPVLAALRAAVAAGQLPVPGSAAGICSALEEALPCDDDESAATSDLEPAGAIAAAAAAAATNTPHFRASQRGRPGAAALCEQLLALQAPAAPDSKPWILLQDCASQHTSAAAHLALQAGQHCVWQLQGALNPIEACWPLLKRRVAGRTFANKAAAMQQLDLVWRGPEMRAAAAAAMSSGIRRALAQ